MTDIHRELLAAKDAEIQRLTRETAIINSEWRSIVHTEIKRWWEAANSFDDNGNATLWKDIADEENKRADAKDAEIDRLTRENIAGSAINAKLAATCAAYAEQVEKLTETLKEARKTIQRASRALTEQCKPILRGKAWGASELSSIDAILAECEEIDGETND